MSKTRKFLTTLTIVAVATTVSLAAVSSAQAHRTGYRHGHHSHSRGGDVALGVLGGLVAGAIIGSARREGFVERPVRRAARPASHVNWCDRRYRSYNPYTDTWIDYSGRERYCISPYVR